MSGRRRPVMPGQDYYESEPAQVMEYVDPAGRSETAAQRRVRMRNAVMAAEANYLDGGDGRSTRTELDAIRDGEAARERLRLAGEALGAPEG